MENMYTEDQKMYDKISEAALIKLYGLAIRNNNELNLGFIDRKNENSLFFVEVANMIQHINKDIKVFINMKNKISYILFKLKNRHLNGISYTKEKNEAQTEELNNIISFMEKEFKVSSFIWALIYNDNFKRKKNKK